MIIDLEQKITTSQPHFKHVWNMWAAWHHILIAMNSEMSITNMLVVHIQVIVLEMFVCFLNSRTVIIWIL